MIGADSRMDKSLPSGQRRVWDRVSCLPLRSLWNLHDVPLRVIAGRTWKALFTDNIFGNAAELGFYFFFSLFPTLFSASFILGLAAHSAAHIYDKLLKYLALVVPTAALGTVIETFHETTTVATSGKLTFGLIAAVWSASVGVSAIQDTLNIVYKIQDTRSYFVARIYAIGLTVLLTILATSTLAALLGADFFAILAIHHIYHRFLAVAAASVARLVGWSIATALLTLCFAVIYHWAPDVKARCWHWLTPGATFGIVGWVLASLTLRLYIHFTNSYSLAYGSLGAIIILLTWFYITGLMLLVGAEINSEIEAAAAEKQLESLPPISG
jgi:membrane protein